MIITRIQLLNFRSFKDKLLEFSPKTTVIVGPNASGKTNIIESISLLSTGKSFHARIEEEMVSYKEEIARVKGSIVEGISGERSGTNLEVVLTRGEVTIGASPEKIEKVAKKRLLVNGVGKRLVDFAGNFKTVLFGPWDLDLVTESPSVRRKFLDAVLSQADREYRRASLSYEKGLRQRNKLLLDIREQGLSRSLLLFWNKLLIKNGDYISHKREEFIDFCNSSGKLDSQKFILGYDRSAISEARLDQYANEEVAAATTLVGPHRDDFIFNIIDQNSRNTNRRELSPFGSRGEQRMGVLWLKLAELAFIESVTGEKPTLLLDDIFSELDHEHRNVVFDHAKNQQTIITTADPHFLEGMEKVETLKLIG
jgi:DNA replication and repair protein RecF